MSDKRKIFNLALAEYGDESVTNPDTDNTVEAGVLRDVYEQVYDSVLELHPWNDAVRRAELPVEETAPITDYANSYLQPTNPYSLRVLSVNGESSVWFGRFNNVPGRGPFVPPAVPNWVVEGRKILTDFGAPLPIVYIARVSEGELRESLAAVIALTLAGATCFKRTQNRALTEQVQARAEKALASAKNIDAQERGQINPFRSDFLQARG